MSKALRRAEHEAKAAKAVEQNWPVFGAFLETAMTELADEIDGLPQFQQDWRLAGEISYQIDKALPFSNPLAEALDGVVLHFVALAVIGVYRAAVRGLKRKERTLDRVTLRLANPTLPPMVRRKAERRQRKLQRMISAA